MLDLEVEVAFGMRDVMFTRLKEAYPHKKIKRHYMKHHWDKNGWNFKGCLLSCGNSIRIYFRKEYAEIGLRHCATPSNCFASSTGSCACFEIPFTGTLDGVKIGYNKPDFEELIMTQIDKRLKGLDAFRKARI